MTPTVNRTVSPAAVAQAILRFVFVIHHTAGWTPKLQDPAVDSALAEFDNRQKRERSRDGMLAAFESGQWRFKAPLGYLTVNARVVPDPERAQFVRDAFMMLEGGLLTQQQVLQRLPGERPQDGTGGRLHRIAGTSPA